MRGLMFLFIGPVYSFLYGPSVNVITNEDMVERQWTKVGKMSGYIIYLIVMVARLSFFFFFLPMTWFPVNSKGCLSVCLLPWGWATGYHGQVVHLWGFCAAWGQLLWGLPCKLDASWSCVLLNFWWEEAECLGEGVLLPNSHKASSWDGLALWLGCDNCFLTLWKHDRRQMVLKRFDEAIAKTKTKTGIK